jgi:hypothetical protein
MGKNHRAPITALSDLCINLRIKFPVKFMSLSYMCINHCPTLTVDIYFGCSNLSLLDSENQVHFQ